MHKGFGSGLKANSGNCLRWNNSAKNPMPLLDFGPDWPNFRPNG
jgi:hypothetical protein